MFDEWKDTVGNLATICTIVLFLSGLEQVARFYKNKSTGEVSPMSFLVGVVMTFVWFTYGRLKGDVNLYTVNGVGFVLQSAFSIIFYLYAVNKTNTMKKLAIVSVILVSLHIYINYDEPNVVMEKMGLLGACMSISYCASPLANIRHVIRSKSSDSLPFYQILMTCIVTGLWTLYGRMNHDSFVHVPNSIGFMFALFQLALFFYYPAVKVPSIGSAKAEILIS